MRVVEKALTFDDVLLVPAHSTILPREVQLAKCSCKAGSPAPSP
jgi:IMP dehydrogenase